MRKAALLLCCALVVAAPATALARRGLPPTEVVGLPRPLDLATGRFPRHIAEYGPDGGRGAPPAAGSWEALAWHVRFGGGADEPAAYVALADWHAAHGEDELAWWAIRRALELGAPDAAALATRASALEAGFRAAGRKDPPTAEQFRFVRDGADRWVKAFQIGERQAFGDHESLTDDAVQRRIGEEADMEVPPAILGAESFMRRWGVGLLIAGVAAVFWTFFLFVILRRRKRPAAA